MSLQRTKLEILLFELQHPGKRRSFTAWEESFTKNMTLPIQVRERANLFLCYANYLSVTIFSLNFLLLISFLCFSIFWFGFCEYLSCFTFIILSSWSLYFFFFFLRLLPLFPASSYENGNGNFKPVDKHLIRKHSLILFPYQLLFHCSVNKHVYLDHLFGCQSVKS